MTDIKRYQEYSYGVEETVIGEFVKYDDHAAIVAAKDERIKALEAMSVANVTPGSVVSDLIKEVNLYKTEREDLKSQLSRYSMSAGQADQRKAESKAVRVALGFGADADDVAPCDLVDAITALREQVRALVAENVLVREQSEEVYAAGYNHGHLNTADGIAYAPGTKYDFYPNALQVMAEVETPATGASIREIRARELESLADVSEVVWLESYIAELRNRAASIRAGEIL